MKSIIRNLFLLSMILFLLSGCQDTPIQEAEETEIPAMETNSPTPEIEEPSPEPTFDTSQVKWIVLGDSITEKNLSAEIKYYDFVQKDFLCEVVNYGRSSTGYKVTGTYEAFYDRIEQIDFSDADVITIFGSFNDLGQGFELGTAEDKGTETIGGCINQTINNIREKAPDIRIGIATPTPWNLGQGYSGVTDSIVYWGVSKEECDQYVALLMEAAEKNEIPVLDLYHAGLFDPNLDVDRAAYFNENGMQDPGVHPSSVGHSLMTPLWKDFLLVLLGQK